MLLNLIWFIDIVVDSAVITKHPFLVKDKDFRCPFSSIRSDYALGFVSQIGKVE